jgi:hypothetical protein
MCGLCVMYFDVNQIQVQVFGKAVFVPVDRSRMFGGEGYNASQVVGVATPDAQ